MDHCLAYGNLEAGMVAGKSPSTSMAQVVQHLNMVEGMQQMLNWHTDAFDIFPSGNDIVVHEFDFCDDGGVIYDKDNVQVIHWRRSHAKDGGRVLSMVWMGDGRPT